MNACMYICMYGNYDLFVQLHVCIYVCMYTYDKSDLFMQLYVSMYVIYSNSDLSVHAAVLIQNMNMIYVCMHFQVLKCMYVLYVLAAPSAYDTLCWLCGVGEGPAGHPPAREGGGGRRTKQGGIVQDAVLERQVPEDIRCNQGHEQGRRDNLP